MNTDPRPLLTRPILILAGGAVLAVMGAGIILFNGGFFDDNREQLVIIEADPAAIKIRPDDPGGVEIDNLNSPVLGLLDPTPDNATTPEVLTANTPPEPPPISVDAPEVAEETEVPQSPPSLKKTITENSSVAQFGAFKNEQGAMQTAALLGQKHKARLNGLTIGYARYNDFWIVITDPLPSYNDARDLCAKFRSHGQDCIPKALP